jgi:3-oxoacyl-[acyl-carrier protein] reductase
MTGNLKDKIVVITGSSSGIGLETAKLMLDNGAKLVLSSSKPLDHYIDNGKLDTEMIEHPNVDYIKCDVRNIEDILNLRDFVLDKYSRADIVINNAGIAEFGPFAEMSIDAFDNQNDIMYRGTFLGIKAFLPNMLENRSGMFVNIISVAAIKTFSFVAAYSGAKAAVLAMSRSLREEVRKDGIKVLNFIPGATNTPIWDEELTNERGSEMLSAQEAAYVLVSNIDLALNPQVMIEDIVLKPQGGDL